MKQKISLFYRSSQSPYLGVDMKEALLYLYKKNNMRHFILILFLLCSSLTYAGKIFNKGVIKGSLKDEKGDAVPFATLLLKNAADSSLYKGEVTSESGHFAFENIKEGSYYIEIKTIGFEKFRSAGISISESAPETDLGNIILHSGAKNLETVTIAADKPFIERQVDKTVVNIENSVIHAGSSVMDVMEKLPGVQVNQDGLISLKGKQGVIVMIDGKPSMLSGQDLANMLRGMNSSSILKIEIITNPSAKYDAAGNAGIINIVTKKNKKEGLNGSVSTGYGQGRYQKYYAGFTIGYKTKRYNAYANYTYSHRKGFNNLTLTRKFYNGDTLNTVFHTDNYIIFPFYTHTPRAGIDLYLSQKTTVSVIGSGVVNNFSPYADNHTDVTDGNNNLAGSYDFSNRSKDQFNNYSVSTELKHQFDSTGKELVVDLDYAHYWNITTNNFSTTFNDKEGNHVNTSYLFGDQSGDLVIYSGKADYSQSLKKQAKFETGIKSSYVTSDNDIKFYNKINEDLIFDTARSSHFQYAENINAAYINFNKEFKKLSVQAGLRAEHTNAHGKQLLNGQTFDRDYVQLFPSIFLDYKFNDKHGLNLNLGRRIDRPAYQRMNPFKKLIDATTYAVGNPYLLPQLSYNSELTYSFKNMFFVTLGYSYTYNNIAEVLIQDAQNKVTVQTPSNIEGFNYYNVNLVFSKKLTKWWTTNSSVLSYYSQYMGTINNYSFNQGWPSISINTSNSFSLAKGLSAEINFQYNHKTLYDVTFINPNNNLTIGLQQSILKKRGSVTVNFSDIFWKAFPTGVTHFAGVDESWSSRRDTRVINVSFTYRFGKGQTRMRKNTGADDEKKRAG
jgi:hypothetical protein